MSGRASCFLGFFSLAPSVSISTFNVRLHRSCETTRDRFDIVAIGIGPESVLEDRRHLDGPESHGEELHPVLVDALGRSECELLLAPLRINRVWRDDRDEKVALADLLRDRVDQRVADVKGDLVIADIEALRLQLLD